jgi:hypothetical protein
MGLKAFGRCGCILLNFVILVARFLWLGTDASVTDECEQMAIASVNGVSQSKGGV